MAGGREKAKAFTEVDRVFVIEVQSLDIISLYLLCFLDQCCQLTLVGAVNASHMCYFKFSSHTLKKEMMY